MSFFVVIRKGQCPKCNSSSFKEMNFGPKYHCKCGWKFDERYVIGKEEVEVITKEDHLKIVGR